MKTMRVVLLVCVLTGAAPACGPKTYHNAVVANTSIADAIFALQDAEIAAHNAGLITAEKHAAYKKQIGLLLYAGDDLTVALKAWDPSKPAPANVGVAIGNVQKLLDDLNLDSPTLSKVIFAAQTVLSVLRGTGVLPADAFAVVVPLRLASVAPSDLAVVAFARPLRIELLSDRWRLRAGAGTDSPSAVTKVTV